MFCFAATAENRVECIAARAAGEEKDPSSPRLFRQGQRGTFTFLSTIASRFSSTPNNGTIWQHLSPTCGNYYIMSNKSISAMIPPEFYFHPIMTLVAFWWNFYLCNRDDDNNIDRKQMSDSGCIASYLHSRICVVRLLHSWRTRNTRKGGEKKLKSLLVLIGDNCCNLLCTSWWV